MYYGIYVLDDEVWHKWICKKCGKVFECRTGNLKKTFDCVSNHIC